MEFHRIETSGLSGAPRIEAHALRSLWWSELDSNQPASALQTDANPPQLPDQRMEPTAGVEPALSALPKQRFPI